MQFNDSARLDPSQMSSGGGGGRLVIGGGMSIVIAIVALLLGINPAEILGGGAAPSTTTGGVDFSNCQTGADIAKDRNCRFVAYTNSIQAYWGSVMGSDYKQAKTHFFTGQAATGCGTATSDVGPFYCPNDQTVYLDNTFFDDILKGQLGAQGGDAAEAYVIAHEYGHHVQDLTGILDKVQSAGNSTGANSPQVSLELQADCYAGVYLNHATDDPNSAIQSITQNDLNVAVDAAVSVGDDRIQRKSQGTVNPDAWTHGSSAQRKRWLSVGFSSGDPSKCNTFSTGG